MKIFSLFLTLLLVSCTPTDNTKPDKRGVGVVSITDTNGYWWGNDIDKSKANYGWNIVKTSPVGNYKANNFGLYDTSGNVWEWRCYEFENKYNGKEKQCVTNGNRLSIRGGSWGNFARFMRSAYRNSVGFRVSRL